ncbi:MAG: CvpA family protein [Alphaproteobacteria bacterium]|nr:CvpA family protein [Alphaproteobacteria bacterium]
MDIGALGLLIFAGAMGLSSGFIHSVLFIGAWVLAGTGAWRFTPSLQPEVQKYVASEQIAYFTTLLGTFVVLLIVLTLVASTIGRWVRASSIRVPDKIIGMAFGVVCGLIVLATAFLLYTYIVKPATMPPIIAQARLFPLVKEAAEIIEPQLPESFKTRAQRISPSKTPDPAAPAAPAAPPDPATTPPDAPVNPGGAPRQ